MEEEGGLRGIVFVATNIIFICRKKSDAGFRVKGKCEARHHLDVELRKFVLLILGFGCFDLEQLT